jgi:hypothetical protein
MILVFVIQNCLILIYTVYVALRKKYADSKAWLLIRGLVCTRTFIKRSKTDFYVLLHRVLAIMQR